MKNVFGKIRLSWSRRGSNILILGVVPAILVGFVFFMAGRGGTPIRQLLGANHAEDKVYQATWGLVENDDFIFRVANLPDLTADNQLAQWQPGAVPLMEAPLRWELGLDSATRGMIDTGSLEYR